MSEENSQEIRKYQFPYYSIESNCCKLVGTTPEMKRVFDITNKLSDDTLEVLITGETGTGKEGIAKALHFNSLNGRKSGKFVAVNCPGIPNTLLEAELFGYERGAFTGANTRKPGAFEIANGGTIFLDEIGELDVSLQAKILRTLQEKEVTRLGSTRPIKIDVRFIAATHRNLEKAVENGKFRQDLYWRINGYPLKIPPLRDRPEDLPYLIKTFIEQNNIRRKKTLEGVSPELLKLFYLHDWPGNVRELKQYIKRAYVMRESGRITKEDILFNEDIPSAPSRTHVLPISHNSIKKEKRISRRALIYKLQKEQIPAELVSCSGKSNRYIIYLTEDTVSRVIPDIPSVAYRQLRKKVRNENFSQFTESPFKGYSPAQIRELGLYPESLPQKLLYTVNRFLHILSIDSTRLMVPEKAETCRKDMEENYRRLAPWFN